ncbi:hypothetical protein [Microbacterium sp. No. 7]|uniref:hypothetical protein n=1 Tax=Microbacterium sp. No. 7 TaxID=1714373 RepID=UPI0012E115F8|nr:hypothetical protein [Microbacterium sp. No. 7]
MTRPHRARIVTRHPVHPLASRGMDAVALTRLRNGAHTLTSEWDLLFADGRLRTRVAAIAPRIGNPLTAVALQSAAAMHGLPVYRASSQRVDVIVPGRTSRKNGKDVVRHHRGLGEQDVVVIDGCRVTSLDRTVYDVIRAVPIEAAVVCFDAALRQVAWDDDTRTYDLAAAEAFRELVWRRIERNVGARGIRTARFVAEFADGRAQLPGESISRLWMWQLGLPAPELQYRIELPDGRFALLDFAWPRLGRWAEFDGKSKYTDADILQGRTVDEVLAEQEIRESQVRAVTGWRCDRWGFDRMPTIDEFASYLRSLGLPGT